MNIVFAISIIIHASVFLLATTLFVVTYKKENYKPTQAIAFFLSAIITAFLNVLIVVVAVKNLDGLQGSRLAVMGYTAFPVIPAIFALLSYSIVQTINRGFNNKIRYGAVLLGIIVAAPVSYALGALLTLSGIV